MSGKQAHPGGSLTERRKENQMNTVEYNEKVLYFGLFLLPASIMKNACKNYVENYREAKGIGRQDVNHPKYPDCIYTERSKV
jgi:hypothetical protein